MITTTGGGTTRPHRMYLTFGRGLDGPAGAFAAYGTPGVPAVAYPRRLVRPSAARTGRALATLERVTLEDRTLRPDLSEDEQ
jgi:hypothetical protein